MIARIAIFLYSLVCYAAGFAVLVYTIGFIGGYVMPKTIDSGAASVPAGTAIAMDVALLMLFALQHSVMARRGFKRVWTRIVPEAAERATYLLFTAAVLALLFWNWQPLPRQIWNAAGAGAAVLTAIYFTGWAVVLLSTFLINHFELFGLQQSFAGLRGLKPAAPRFVTPFFYRFVRHPLYTGLLMAFWAAPVMSEGRLLFSLVTTGYIFAGIALEERDLIAFFGEKYLAYRRAVPMVIPLPRPAGRAEKAKAAE